MKQSCVPPVLCCLSLIFARGVMPAASAELPADRILRNGVIVTANEDFGIAACVAMRGGVIAAVGSEADIAPYAGPATEIIDLQGECLLPGLIDSHCHPSAAALAETDHERRPPMQRIDDVLTYVASGARC